MTQDQISLILILLVLFGLLLWGRWRYDLVAFGALIFGVIFGVIPTSDAFSGFGHPATIIIALVLIVSTGLTSSGAVEVLTRRLVSGSRSVPSHIGLMGMISALLSAVINNVAALALLMPVDMQTASREKRSPAMTLMPLSFASILGGMITLIGTPPNIIIASFRGDALGESYHMFDFAPVGLACAVVGILFIALFGWRLIPSERSRHNVSQELEDLEGYISEIKLRDGSSLIGMTLDEVRPLAEKYEVQLLGLVRNGKRLRGFALSHRLRRRDILVVEAGAESLESFSGAYKLGYAGDTKHSGILAESLMMVEVVVPQDSRLVNRAALDIRLLYRHNTTLLGVSRQGRRFRDRVRSLVIRPGDMLLLLGREDELPDTIRWLGCLPLAERGTSVIQRQKAWLASGIFGFALFCAISGLLYLPVALSLVVFLYVLLRIVPLSQLYESVEWPAILLLGCLIPLGAAFESSGLTTRFAWFLVDVLGSVPPWVMLVILMVITMTISDVLNNVATTLIAAPIALSVSQALGVNADAFLMGVAVAASSAFLTPIGHKNNIIILGPGGYRFGDYWRMGLPLEILIILVSVPVLLFVWPL